MNPTIEQLHSVLGGFRELRKNPCYAQIEDRIKAERDACLAVIISGDFPPSNRDGATGGDFQGILYREQQVGEARALARFAVYLDTVINGLAEQITELQAEKDQTNNET
jgi:hypothetical protein